MAMVRSEGNMSLKNPVTPPGVDPGTVRLVAQRLNHGGSSKLHIYTQTIHRTTQLATLVGRLSGIRIQSSQTKINDELTA